MSNNIEDEIVSMKFDNKQFESGVSSSIGMLDRLKTALQFRNAGDGFNTITNNARGFSLNPITDAISGVNKGFLGMTTVALTALGTITTRAVNAGIEMTKKFTIDPIAEGFQNYETKINAVQTILANTKDQGTNLKQVTGTLNQLNKYANQTVYNFSEMAKNIGTFTAAGVDLKTSTSSIKGIANLAALSGSTSAQASSAMYQLSQAIAAGQVHLQDWNSVVNAGIGGAVFQKNLIETALATGKLDASQVHLGKTMKDTTVNGMAFRQSLTPPPGGTSWLTSDVLTTSLSTFTGDATKAQLAAKGFTKEQIKQIIAQGKTAENAATKIKTFTQLFQALKEEVGTAYASVFEALFGNIKQAKHFLSPLHTFIENALTRPIYEVADALKSWRKQGGFDDLVHIFKNLGAIVGNLLYPFKVLFSAILPGSKNAGKGLAGFTHTLAVVTKWIAKATSVTHDFGLVLWPLKVIFNVLKTATVAFFKALAPLLPLLNKFGSYIRGMFDQGLMMGRNLVYGWIAGLDFKELRRNAENLANNFVQWIKDALGIHSPARSMIPVGKNVVAGISAGLGAGAQTLIKGLQKLFIGMGKALKYLVDNISYDDILNTINSGLFLGLVLLFKRFVDVFSGTMKQFQEILGKGGEVLDQITNNLKAMQQKVQSEAIRNIAISVVLLAGAALLLSTLDTKKLKVALLAIGGLMAGLVGAMKIVAGGKGTKDMSGVQLAKRSSMLLALGTAMVAFSTSIVILAGAVAILGHMKPGTVAQGLKAVAGVIALITASTAILGKTGGGGAILAASAAMVVMAVALTEFAGVMKLYSKLSWHTLIKGGLSAVGVIVAVGLALQLFKKGAFAGSVALTVAAAGLLILAQALKQVAHIGLGKLIKAVVAIDFMLGTIAGAALEMEAALPGAAAILVVAGAMVVLADALKIISKIPLWDLVKAIGAIAIALLVVGGTAAALSELSPLIAAFGTALLLVGGAVFLAGVGILAFATALGIIGVVGPAAFGAMNEAFNEFLDTLPRLGEVAGEMFVSFFVGLTNGATELQKAIGKLIGVALDAFDANIPKMQKTGTDFIDAMIAGFEDTFEHWANTVIRLVFFILNKIDNNYDRFRDKGTDILVKIIVGFGKTAGRVTEALARSFEHFLTALDRTINKHADDITEKGIKVGKDLAKGVGKGLRDSLGDAASNLFLGSILGPVLAGGGGSGSPGGGGGSWGESEGHKTGTDYGSGVSKGIDSHKKDVRAASRALILNAQDQMQSTIDKNHDKVQGMIDMDPKITPVLDLTQLAADAGRIDSILGSHDLSLHVTHKKAAQVGSGGGGQTKQDRTPDKTDRTVYNFNQVNHSPKPINPLAVYRGTKSQIELFKEVTHR